MRVWDFDGTICKGDSTAQFYLYCLRRRPRIARRLPRTLWALLRWRLGFIDKTGFKQALFQFLRDLDDTQEWVDAFWRARAHIKPWYARDVREDDLILSASPEFLLLPALRGLGLSRDNLIASRVDPKTGVYDGVNCSGAEKVRRFRERFPAATPDAFYSDSRADAPMARISNSSYFVRGDRVRAWDTKATPHK